MYTRVIFWLLAASGIECCHGFALPSTQQQQQQFTIITPRQTQFLQQLSASSSRTTLYLSQDSSTNSKKEEELTLSKIAELVDVSFVQACLQLAEGYVDTLKLMIAAVQSAYVQGIPPHELIREINAISTPSAGRALLPEEEQLRNQWIQIVYIMLAALSYKVTTEVNLNGMEMDAAVKDTFGKAAPILIRRRQLSADWNGQEMLAATSSLFSSNHHHHHPLLQKALTLQSLRVMWVTMSVVEDVERCEGEFAKMDAPLAPPIPGAFESEFLP